EDELTENEEVERDFVEGCTQMMRGNFEEALRLFEKVLEADPDNHPAQYNSARIYLDQKNYEKAIELSQQAVRGQIDNYWYHKFLVRSLRAGGDIDRAINAQNSLVNQFPEKSSEKMDLADLYFKSGNADGGLKVLDQLQKEKGISRLISLKKFEVEKERENYEGALESINELIEIGDTETGIYQRQYEMLYRLGRFEEGVSTLNAILDQDPDNGFALLYLADYYKKQDQIEKSDEYLFRAFANPLIEWQGKMNIIQQLLPYADSDATVKGRLTRLLEIFNQAHPDNPEALLLMGRLGGNEATVGAADLDAVRNALEKQPMQIDLWLELLNASNFARNYEQLYKDAEFALEYYPNQIQFLYYYGKSASKTQDYSAAEYAFNKLIKIAQNDMIIRAKAHIALAQAYKEKGENEKRDIELEKVSEIIKSPTEEPKTDPEYLAILGDYYAVAGLPELAEAEWEKAIEKGFKLDIKARLKDYGYEKE
ncbi:MAG: tetratricopeptide repeat protein, partial [Bacteroidota bacterium]